MKILEYFEKAWIAAAVAAFIVMIYNLITLRIFDYHVYFPLFCALFCLVIWQNIRGQRRLRDKMLQEEEEKNKEKK